LVRAEHLRIKQGERKGKQAKGLLGEVKREEE
jgi:hypothetical protein